MKQKDFLSKENCKIILLPPRTGGSVGWASGYDAGGREFDSDRTITQGLKITEEKVLCNYISKWLDFQVFSDKDFKP